MRLLAIALLAALAAGCAGPITSDIAVTDRSVFLPAGRLSVDLSPRGDRPSVPHTGHGIEFGITGGKGDDTQSLAAGAEPVKLGNQTFGAPVELKHELDFRFAEIAYRYRKFFGAGQFGIEALGGLGYAELDLTVTSATQRANEKLGSHGLVGGFGFIWNFRPATSLQSRLTLFGALGDLRSAGRVDAYVAQALGSNVALRAGWAYWGARSEPVAFRSTIRLRFSGPALGLDVMF